MASIRRRRNSFSVVYTYVNEKGEKKQKWETYPTYEEAHKRRAEVEYKQDSGTFIAPSKLTVEGFLEDFGGVGRIEAEGRCDDGIVGRVVGQRTCGEQGQRDKSLWFHFSIEHDRRKP